MFKKTFSAILLPVFFVLLSNVNIPCFASNTARSEVESASISVYERITPSIVAIDADLEQGISSGTGCIIDPSGVILTSSHVINQSKNIEVTTQSGKTYKATVFAVLKDKNDLALIKITPKEKLPTIRLGDSETVKVGQRVLAIGNPFGFRGTLTTGIISRIEFISYMELPLDYDIALIIRISPHIIILHQTKLAWIWLVLIFAVSEILKF